MHSRTQCWSEWRFAKYMFSRLLALFALLSVGSDAKVTQLSIENDSRAVFSIETFGFVTNGVLNITVNDFNLEAPGATEFRMAILVRLTSSETEAIESVEVERESTTCMIDEVDLNFFTIELDGQKLGSTTLYHVVTPEEQGLYHILFTRCSPEQGKVTMNIETLFYNPGPDYLSAGESPVPTILFVYSAFFTLALVAWVRHIRAHPAKVHHVHHIMSVLLLVKILTLLAEGFDKHYMKIFGEPLGWNVVFYIFTFVRGSLFFTVILLIGTGWSLLKPSLNTREKKILLVVLPLQVLDNIALIVEEEIATGSQSWLQWRDVLHLVDLVCCAAILFPIVWQQVACAQRRSGAAAQRCSGAAAQRRSGVAAPAARTAPSLTTRAPSLALAPPSLPPGSATSAWRLR